MTLSEAQPVAYAGSSPFTPVTGSLRAPPLVCCHCCFPDTCPQPAPPRPRKTPRAPRCSGPAWKPPLSPSDSRGWGPDLGVIPGPLQFAHSPPTAAERTRPGPAMRTGRRPPVRSPWRHRAEQSGRRQSCLWQNLSVTFQGQLGLRRLGRGVVTVMRETHPQRTIKPRPQT